MVRLQNRPTVFDERFHQVADRAAVKTCAAETALSSCSCGFADVDAWSSWGLALRSVGTQYVPIPPSTLGRKV